MSERNGLEVAVIGLASRFPKARNTEQFWCNLRDGVDCISFFSPEELKGLVPDSVLANPNYVPALGALADHDLFDAAFFDFSPREAEILDPQHRLLLELGWEALENAGYAGTSRPVGVFVGISQTAYLLFNVLSHPEVISAIGAFGLMLANEKDFAATRMAYKLGLEGPSLTVQTACSTSLLATHLACQSLLAGECEIALAGGASVGPSQRGGHVYQEGGIVSRDGRTRAFDARATGTAGGQGGGIVVLKLLEDALADGDSIHAVIKGSAINNDGSQKPGYTAPRRDGQAKVIRAAQRRAEVDADSMDYIEAHGTGTPLGDPIEVAALIRAFRATTQRCGYCALGSVKTNIGHTDAAAGVASLIKTILAIENAELPPSLHYESANPEIDFAASPFYVNTELRSWPRSDRPRRAGVSSFGMGGSNAHVILEEAPPATQGSPSRPWQPLVLSARTPAALERAVDDLAAYLASHPAQPLADVAWTLRAGRRSFRFRRALVAATTSDAAEALAARDPRRVLSSEHEPGNRPVAFLLPGVGDQYAGMAAGLYRAEPVFRAEIDLCAELLLSHLGLDLRDLLFGGKTDAPAAGDKPGLDLRALLKRGQEAAPSGPLHDTRLAQPAVFAVGYALARLWMSLGVQPQALLGYSLGEYTAACLAGVFSLPDAAGLVARRARMISELPAGAMLAVPLSEEETLHRLTSELSLAAVNSPAVSVVAGAPDAVAAFEGRLRQEGFLCRRVQTSHAFHSTLMEPISGAFRDLLRAVDLRPPQIPYVSNVTGTWVRAEQAIDPEHWIRHLCGTVRFAAGAAELWHEPGRVLLEAGPGLTLGSLALQSPASAGASAPVALPSLRHEHEPQDDQAFLVRTLAQLWLAGVEADPRSFWSGEKRHRVPLPTYPFERQRFWLDPLPPQAIPAGAAAPSRIAEVADWFHVPSWRMAPRPAGPAQSRDGLWLVLAGDHAVETRLLASLEARGRRVATARTGDGFTRLGEHRYLLAPGRGADFDALLADLGETPETIVHLWTLTGSERTQGREGLSSILDRGFHSLISLAQALGKRGTSTAAAIHVVTDGLLAVERHDALLPEKATLVGPVRVITQEYPHLICRALDIDQSDEGLADELVAEIESGAAESLLALRGDRRWIPSTEALNLPALQGRSGQLRDGGVYLITGGLGGIGLAVAAHLADTVHARLVLVGRTPLPQRTEWPLYLAEGTEANEANDGLDRATARRVRSVANLEAAGAEVLVIAADVTDVEQMREVVERSRNTFGRLDGVFHAAGLPGAGLIQLKERDTAAAVMAPKVDGTLALAEVLSDLPGCFLVLFSALTGLTGGIGQVDYCAANAFLDAFAQCSRQRGGAPVIAVDWCEWQWDDWADRLTAMDPRLHEELQRQRRAYGLSFEEGMEALTRILASGQSQVIVSTRDLRAVLTQQHSMGQLLGTLGQAKRPTDGGHERPPLATPFAPPTGEIEERLTGIWRDLLGVGKIGVHDNFFQLGGHSLLGLQVMSRIQENFRIDLPLRILFEAPTIAELATAVAAGDQVATMPEIRSLDAQRVLENLDDLSEQEMDEILALMAEEEQFLG